MLYGIRFSNIHRLENKLCLNMHCKRRSTMYNWRYSISKNLCKLPFESWSFYPRSSCTVHFFLTLKFRRISFFHSWCISLNGIKWQTTIFPWFSPSYGIIHITWQLSTLFCWKCKIKCTKERQFYIITMAPSVFRDSVKFHVAFSSVICSSDIQ